jgi:uncharacterized membrane protein
MTTIFLVVTVVFFLGIVLGTAFFLRRLRQPRGAVSGGLPFRRRYVALPVGILIFSLALSVIFYGLLPDEIAYRFKLDGSPESFLSRGNAVVIMMTIQLLLALVAVGIVWMTTRLRSLTVNRESLWVQPEKLLLLMGNMPAIPQLILAFALADIFSYNAYDTHIMPFWLFALIILVLGAVVIGIFAIPVFFRALRGMKSTSVNNEE